jgi:hypothetical protein
MNLEIPATNDYKHRNEVGAHTSVESNSNAWTMLEEQHRNKIGAHTSVESKERYMHNVKGAT